MEYLVEGGIAPERLIVEAHATSQLSCSELLSLPREGIEGNKDIEECRERNRTVKFSVLLLDGEPFTGY